MKWLQRNSLWLISLGIMATSAGIDGAYMAKLMPPILGYALNAVSDIASEVLIYWYARLKQYPKNTKRHRMAWGLLVGEVLLTGFAWLFGWRQLLPIITAIEGADIARWLAPVLAAFTPTLLIAAGYTQALLAGRIESEALPAVQAVANPLAIEAMQIAAHSDNGNDHACPYCDRSFATVQGVNAHLRFCKEYKLQKVAG